jgi:hypothetical protein
VKRDGMVVEHEERKTIKQLEKIGYQRSGEKLE